MTNESEEFSNHPLVQLFYEKYNPLRLRISEVSLNWVAVTYSIIGFCGLLGNLLVFTAIITRKPLRTERNLLILNLSISDMWQCLLTIPMTYRDIKYRWWTLSAKTWICRTFTATTSISVFVSTLSITAIAIDRCWVICNPHSKALTFKKGMLLLPFLWGMSFLMALPVTLFKNITERSVSDYSLQHFSFANFQELYEKFANSSGTEYIGIDPQMCVEHEANRNMYTNLTCNWDNEHGYIQTAGIDYCCYSMKKEYMRGLPWKNTIIYSCSEDVLSVYRLLYSVLTLLFQYLLPGITITYANQKIYRVLQDKERSIVSRSDAERRKEEILRIRRNKKLLRMIGTVFLVLWLPLNIFNLISDTISFLNQLGYSASFLHEYLGLEATMIIYSITHFAAMLCTAVNPILYGFFNENFNKELKKIVGLVRDHIRSEKGGTKSTVQKDTLENL